MPAAMEVEIEKENVEEDTAGKNAAPSSQGVSADDSREAFSPDLLRIYYARLFPYEQV